jgi:tRNA U34 5-methylaminomethyl-2-thiouridine-forming methyltransferase MnmC
MEKRPLNPQIVESGDGSHTLKVDALKEHYHSHKGAIQESIHVFLSMGLQHSPKSAYLSILEVGFGTGLNALLTALHNDDRKIRYTTLEAYPLDLNVVRQLNYPERLEHPQAQAVFEQIHTMNWGEWGLIKEGFELFKLETTLQEYDATDQFDLVYYDAFAPHAQPELWEPAIWEKMFASMRNEGLLVTYCAKGQVRRDMQAAGFTVERLQGPPGKREMLRAIKP